ncbi:multidrug effflux MFS transporter [Fluviispira multicolorata]|uniref:Bcr/CflA family efflux MFS transporter n=1 Tax=Fluviispira multicolorata TaxID=2654512 RepID=A0A833JDW6_9BACT|nr:multidrug effflux MFS transporter [Fluviispira multicolorata]KAB8029201.1 Bcr/CflA family efflux MFS transporter [Fluviispira multicolorata]
MENEVANQAIGDCWGKLRTVFFVSCIIFICAIGFVASDIYLPSLPAIADYFKKDAAYVQLTMSLFLLTMAVFQIFSGSLSDKYGRKKVLFICILIFIISSVGCFYAASINELIFYRCLQAIGACAGMSIGQAMVADTYGAKETGRILSITIPLVAFSPAIAPVLGGYVEMLFDWRAIFLLLVVYGFIILIMLLTPIIPNKAKYKENLQIKKAAFDVKIFIKMLKDKKFFGFALFMMTSNATYFSFLAGAPFLLKKFGYSPSAVGYAFCLASFPYMFASLLGRRLSLTRSSLQIIFLGLLLSAMGGILFLFMYFSAWQHMLGLMIPIFVITIGNGLLMPFSSANAIALFPKNSGLVTGTLGSAQLTAASLGTALMGFVENGTFLPFALIVLSFSIFTIIYYLSVFKNSALPSANEGIP